MKSTEPTVMWQNPNSHDSHLYRVVRSHLDSPDIKGVRTAVAYVSWGGLSLIAESLEAFLKKGRTLETLFGIQNGVTTPDALLYSIYLSRRYASYTSSKAVLWDYSDSTFHPKMFEFLYPDHSVCIVGSGNLTGGGMACNHELATSFSVLPNTSTHKELRKWWKHYFNAGTAITPQTIRDAKRVGKLGSELKRRPGDIDTKRLGLVLPRAKKPVFQHILDETGHGAVGHEVLADADSLSVKPDKLYLQILEHETGGGHQIQLPVASLGAFFGVGAGDVKAVEIIFPDLADSVDVQLTHFENNTHRVRLRPLKKVPRPAVVVFSRTEDESKYECRIVPQRRYSVVLRQKCQEQTRRDSRQWGLGE